MTETGGLKNECLICGECGDNEVDTVWEDYTFPYGPKELTCKVPVRICKTCGFRFLDYEAETLIGAEIVKENTRKNT